jgi:hypothetical protein
VADAAVVAWMLHRVLFGAPNPESPPAADASLPQAWYLGILLGTLLWVGLVPGGPKLFGVPLFDPGLVNVVNSSTPDLSSPYAVPSPSPPPTPTPAPSVAPSSRPGSGATPSPSR